jgi:hypothetical protein
MPVGRSVRIVGALAIGLLWLVAFVVAGAAGLELLLKVRSHWLSPPAQTGVGPKYQQLLRAYDAFGVNHLHPQYVFFFPLDPRERVALSNETCSIDADGFRGPGPAHAGNRRLAFLLGGSAAFGLYASSDATTITGYLNRLQDEYFFVNAGVPAWNSTQELFRISFQILAYSPALVVTYDGANDALLLEEYREDPVQYPVGSPANFDHLAEIVNARESAPGKRAATALSEYLFPELKGHINTRLEMIANARAAAPVESVTLPESLLHEGTARYLSNLALIRDLTTARGARFLSVVQPMAQLHRHLEPGLPLKARNTISEFHRRVLTTRGHDFELHDLGDVFDRYYAAIPVLSRDVTDATIFVDDVHLYDPGNEIVARELSRLIQ